jgi:hypothetical protein
VSSPVPHPTRAKLGKRWKAARSCTLTAVHVPLKYVPT